MMKYLIRVGCKTNTEIRVLENYFYSCSEDVSMSNYTAPISVASNLASYPFILPYTHLPTHPSIHPLILIIAYYALDQQCPGS